MRPSPVYDNIAAVHGSPDNEGNVMNSMIRVICVMLTIVVSTALAWALFNILHASSRKATRQQAIILLGSGVLDVPKFNEICVPRGSDDADKLPAGQGNASPPLGWEIVERRILDPVMKRTVAVAAVPLCVGLGIPVIVFFVAWTSSELRLRKLRAASQADLPPKNLY